MLTEAEWRISDDLQAMLAILRGNPCASERKLRLYACICAESAITQLSKRAEYEHILSTAERWAEGLEQPDEVQRSWDVGVTLELNTPIEAHLAAAVTDTLQTEAYLAACGTVTDLDVFAQLSQRHFDPKPYADLLRCIFGIPYRGFNVGFRLIRLDPQWRTSDVVALARGIYDDRAFDRMPILADALQDADCRSEDILTHCRDTSTPHARGCWVVDLVLGKA